MILFTMRALSLTLALCALSGQNFALQATTRQPWQQVQVDSHNTVVQVYTQIAAIDLCQPYRTPDQQTARGSAFFMSKDGLLVTCAHVVDGGVAIWIRIPSLGKRFIEVEVVGVCPDRDIALLRLKDEELATVRKELGSLEFLSLGDSDGVGRADEVLALGYPLGQESLKSTSGVISGREGSYIQMSAPINPGNSGGPLLDVNGFVVGINSAGITNAQNVGYSIPINELHVIMSDLLRKKLLRRPFLGILSVNANDSLAQWLGNPMPGGCYLVEVIKDSPLDKAGVQAGDMLYEINGCAIDVYGDVVVPWADDKISIFDYVSRLKIGEDVNLVAYRNGECVTFSLKLDWTDTLPIRRVYPTYEDIDYEVFGGMVVMELTLNHIKQLSQYSPGLSRFGQIKQQTESVLVITHIFPNSSLYRVQAVEPGATINEVNGVAVKTLADFRAALRTALHAEEFFVIRASDNVTCATDNIMVALPFEELLQQEVLLSQMYHYPLADALQEVFAAT